jgi:hypothetical protein
MGTAIDSFNTASPTAVHWNSGVLTERYGLGSLVWIAGVDCPTATTCVAAGTNGSASGTGKVGYLGRWTGGAAWSSQAAPGAATNVVRRLSDVQCVTATSCFAVGTYSTPTHRYATILRYI